MFEWGSRGAGDRGVSHVLGVVLLASVVIVGAVLIVQVGQQTIGDVNDDANVELAEEVMLSVDQSFQRSNTDESVEIPDRVRSDVGVSNKARYNLTLNGRPACSTGNRSLQTMRYQKNGQQVGYQGGGVWRMTDSGATMSSPPAVNYDEGALSVSFANISGQQIEGGSVSIQSNATAKRSHQAALQIAMFTNRSYEEVQTGTALPRKQVCLPSRVKNATLTIDNSTYARAWADWAASTYDDKYVTVTPDTVASGETVHIRFALGDVSDPKFDVNDMRVTHNQNGPGANVSATIHNTGGLRSTQDVIIEHNRSGTPTRVVRTVTLAGDQSKRVNATVGLTDATHNISVTTDAAAENETIVAEGPNPKPTLQITDQNFPVSSRLNAAPPATITVTNTGDMTADQTVTFFVNGSENATRSVLVHPSEEQTLDFSSSLPTGENGTYELSVETNDSRYNQPMDDGEYFEVGYSGVFEVTSVSPPGGLTSGDSATVEATIDNTGVIQKSDTVEIRIENATTGATVASKTTNLALEGTLSGSESETVSLTTAPINVDSTQHFTYIIDTADDAETGSFAVGATAPPTFEITNADVDNPVNTSGQTTVEVTVANTGGTAGEQDITIDVDGFQVAGETEQLDPGESVTLDRQVTAPDTYGQYPVTVATANRSRVLTLIAQPDSSVEINGSTVTVKQAVNASVVLKGSDLEFLGSEPRSDVMSIRHWPVTMSLFVRNDSDSQSIGLWRDYENGDVNGPYAERRQVSDDYENPYSYAGSFDPGTDISVFAKSHGCEWTKKRYDYDDDSDSEEYYVRKWKNPKITLAGYETRYCANDDWTDWLTVSETQNSGNLEIRGDGDPLPAFEQAADYQRGVNDVLGDRVNESGHLQLADGEQAFFYELSIADANPEKAKDPGDPDYNDAVILFKINSIEKSVNRGPAFQLDDVDAPARVDETTDATATAEVTNVGDMTGEVTLEGSFDGGSVGTKSVTLDPNETTSVTLTLPTSSKASGISYPYTVSVVDSPQAGGGNIHVGDTTDQFMQVDSVRAPRVIDSDDTATATVNVTNVGGKGGTDTVVLRAKNTDDPSPSFTTVDSEAMSTKLTPGDTRQFTLDMPTSRGNYTYYVETSNSTSPEQSFFVGQSNFVVNDTQSVNIGAETYNTSGLIERRGGAQRMTVEVQNNGTVGDEREVSLTIKNKSDGSTVFAGSKMVTAGSGDLTNTDPYPAWAGYDVDLDPGYYTYEVTVYDETASGTEADTATGEIYLKNVDETGATGNDSPITVDSDTVTLGG